jgi:N-acyl-D-aspartate/D-glutamate deacylase
MANWAAMVIIETFHPDNKQFEGQTVGEIAASLNKRPFDVLLDIVCSDDLLTTFSRRRPNRTAEDEAALASVLRDPRTVVGGSDAGAHLDMIATFNFATAMLELTQGDNALLTLEEAVHHVTERPGRLYGLVDRGRIAPGWCADLVLFDPAAVGSGPVHTVTDLPGGAPRLFATSRGVISVFVNGTQIVDQHEFTPDRPGCILRSGRHTATPSLAW